MTDMRRVPAPRQTGEDDGVQRRNLRVHIPPLDVRDRRGGSFYGSSNLKVWTGHVNVSRGKGSLPMGGDNSLASMTGASSKAFGQQTGSPVHGFLPDLYSVLAHSLVNGWRRITSMAFNLQSRKI